MTVVYAIVLIAAIVGLIGWVLATAVGEGVAGWAWVDPEARFGRPARLIVAAALGFGMGGMSATFAGLPVVVSLLGSVAGAVGVAAVAWFFGPSEAPEQ